MDEALLLAMTAASGSGGGGSSDFSTCELTFINRAEDAYDLMVANIGRYADTASTTYSCIWNGGFGNTEKAYVILYKGKAWATFRQENPPPDSDISVTGDIEYDDLNDAFIITGDGTITIAY